LYVPLAFQALRDGRSGRAGGAPSAPG